jgi:fatty acid desaturase
MASENLSDARPAYVRFLFLVLGEAIAGLLLYATFRFMPTFLQIAIILTGLVILQNDILFHPKKNKSLASLLCAITAIPTFSCYVVWRISHGDGWERLMLVGGCLMAALILLDGRADA